MTIGERIKSRRKELGMSADELGRKLGKDRSTIYRYENGEIETFSLDLLQPLAEALETTDRYLMGWGSDDHAEIQKKNDALSDIVQRLRTDEVFLAAVKSLNEMEPDRLSGLLALLK